MNSPSLSPPLLSLHRIGKRFGTVNALVDVDAAFVAGEVHAVLGENGAGKSTLMNAIYGLVAIDSGTIRLHGEPVRFRTTRDARRAGIGMVHQEFALVDALSVAENLALSLAAPGSLLLDHKGIAAAARRLADEIGLEMGDLDAPVATLPVGVRQRVEIVKALAGETRILILDEPTAVLTPAETAQLFRILRRLCDRGTAVLFITHKLREVMDVADRVTVLRRGRVVARELRAEITENKLAERMVGTKMTGRTVAHQPTAETAAPRLQIKHLDVRNERGIAALRDVSLAVRPGEVFGIAGVDGNGQSELFEVLAGLRRPTNGEVTIDVIPVVRFEPPAMIAAGIGIIPPDRQRQGAISAMTVQDNAVLNSASLQRIAWGPFLPIQSCRRVAEELIDHYQIRTPGLQAPASSLSGGNLQRLIVARTLALQPRVLLAFNPTRGLDIVAAQGVYRSLSVALERDTAVLLISTDVEEILAVSNRLAILYRGQLSEIFHPPFPTERLGLMLAGGIRPP